MTLLFMEGFDHILDDNDLKLGKWASAGAGFDTNAVITPYGVGRSAKIDYGDSITTTSLGSLSTIILGADVYLDNFGSSGATIFRMLSPLIENVITVGNDGSISFYRSSGVYLLGTSTNSINIGNWHFIEAKITISNTAGSVEIRVNGDTWLSLSNIDTQQTNPYVNSIDIPGSSFTDVYYDNLYICDDTGTSNNDFLGPVRVETLWPDGDDGIQDWIATGAGTTNSDRVNELTEDGDTSYVQSGTVGDIDNYTYDDLSLSPSEIFGVQVTSTAKRLDAGVRNMRNRISHGGSTTNGVSAGLGSDYVHVSDIVENCPSTGTAWTKAQIDTMTAGIEVVT